MTPDGMEVAYVDPSAGVMIATQSTGSTATATSAPTSNWSTEKVAPKVAGIGLDATLTKDGTVLMSFYSGNGTVELASGSPGATWSLEKVAEVVDPDPQAVGNAVWTTGVAADDSGAVSVTWYDKDTDSVKLASGASASALAPVDTPGTLGGAEPALGVSPDGSNTYLSWYDVSTTSLLVGVLGSAKGVEIAAPSPTPTALAQTATVCSPTGTNLSITALNTAFDKSCLAAPADKAFKIVFDNQDPFNHNVAIYDSSNKVLFTGPLTASPTTYHVGGLPAGTYKFQCDVHPTVMNGIFIVAK
jgi:plastocyanin